MTTATTVRSAADASAAQGPRRRRGRRSPWSLLLLYLEGTFGGHKVAPGVVPLPPRATGRPKTVRVEQREVEDSVDWPATVSSRAGRQPRAQGDGARARGARQRRRDGARQGDVIAVLDDRDVARPQPAGSARRCAAARGAGGAGREPICAGPGRCSRSRRRRSRTSRRRRRGPSRRGRRWRRRATRVAEVAGDARRDDPARAVRRRRRRAPRRSRRHGRARASRSRSMHDPRLAATRSEPVRALQRRRSPSATRSRSASARRRSR